MTTKYFAILTNQGAARLANATMLGTKLNITQMAVGDGNGTLPTPDPDQTKLINQTRIAPINSLSVDVNDAGQIIAEQIIPENEGGFFIREIGLYDDDGILIAVANCPETYKPLLAEGSGRTQTIRMILVVSSTSAITLKIDPSVVLATRKYVDDAVIEVKNYTDNVMKKHVDADNPHNQYPLIANALKEIVDAGLVAEVLKNLGIPKLLDDRQPINDMLTGFARLDGQPGNAANNIPYISGKNVVTTTPLTAFMRSMFRKSDATEVLSLLGVPDLLEDRQPINSTLTAFARLDGKPGNAEDNIPYFSAHNTVITTALTSFMRTMLGKEKAADVLALLGTKTAALRDVGTGVNQIPDMSSFAFSNATQGFMKYPGGLIEQWFIATVPQAPSATVNGTIDVLFPTPFPNKCYGVNVNYAGITATRDGVPFLSGIAVDKFACRVASTYLNSGLDVFVRAVGY